MNLRSHLPVCQLSITEEGKYDCPEGVSCRLGEGLFDFKVKVGDCDIDTTYCFFKRVLIYLDIGFSLSGGVIEGDVTRDVCECTKDIYRVFES